MRYMMLLSVAAWLLTTILLAMTLVTKDWEYKVYQNHAYYCST